MMTRDAVAMVAEKEDFYNAGLAAVLKHQVGYATVLRAKSLDELLAVSEKASVSLVALADDLPGSNGAQTVRQLRAQFPDLRLVVLTRRSEVREILSYLAAGAHGVIPKRNSDCADLLRALRTVSDDGVFVPPMAELDDTELNGNSDGATHALSGLTERQRQVIHLLSRGYPNKVIARELGISPCTVKVHVHAAFRALGVHSRVAAVAALSPRPLQAASRP